MISEELLQAYSAEKCHYHKADFIFREGQNARYYFQVISGEVKMNNFNADGKEFIQAIFSAGRSFGEPPLFGDFTYPANALALSEVFLYRLAGERFFELIKAYPEIHLKLTKTLSSRLYYKSIMATELSFEEAGHRILRFLDYLKKDVYQITAPYGFEVRLTRQQLADLTGLRVETVIRTVKKLALHGELRLKESKIFR